ncbi:MAG: Fic family protein [Selenomonas sp.]|nr:Fic family protein [Selenomonas sp.]
MGYESLRHLFYAHPEQWETTYQERFRSPFTRHLPLAIQQFGRPQPHPAFYCYTEELAVLQERIHMSFQSCMTVVRQVPHAAIGQFLQHALIEEIKSTNDIEGVRSTRREILQALDAPPEERRKFRLGSIVGKYVRILKGGDVPLKDSRDIRALYDDFIADEIRHDDPRNLPDGEIFRSGSVDIRSASQKVLHRGVYPEKNIVETMDQALAFLQDGTMPMLIRTVLFHYFFGYIHPFYDGNGRMARFIMSYLLSREFHPTVALQLSLRIKQHRKAYYDLFMTTDDDRNCGDLTPFLLGMMGFVAGAIAQTRKMLAERRAVYAEKRKRFAALSIDNKTTRDVGDILLQATVFSDAGATMRDICAALRKTETTIRKHIEKLPAGMVRIDKSMRPYRYRFDMAEL